MADKLRRLLAAERSRELQEKLERWYRNYETNSRDQNLHQCCEIIELISEIQGQLFTIFNKTSEEGGHCAGTETLKTRLLPRLRACLPEAAQEKLFETNLSLIQLVIQSRQKMTDWKKNPHEAHLQKRFVQDSIEKENQLLSMSSNLTFHLKELQKELTSTRLALNRAKQVLDTVGTYKEDAQRTLDHLKDYKQQIQIPQDESSVLDAQNSILQSRLARSHFRSPRRGESKSPSPLYLRSCSPGRARRTNASRRAYLVARFGDIYAQERLDAETLLRTYISDMETVQRIIYIAAVESFCAAKMAYRQFKIHVRQTLSIGHSGPELLEDRVLDFVIQHENLYDVQTSVNEVIRSMNINPKISVPPEIDFIVISTLIRELCRVAFSMQALVPPLDISFGIDGELFSENKYHRDVGSDFAAAFVAYHVWPALMEKDIVIMKGRAVTKRGALCSCRCTRRSRSRSRSPSPLQSRHLSPTRSPSPRRSGSPRR